MPSDLSVSKSICLLATVVVCFAILWPSIFYPMLQSALGSKDDEDQIRQERLTPRPLTPDMHPALKQRGRAIPESVPRPKQPKDLPPSDFPDPEVIISAKKRPAIPGMRPPMGGAGHIPQQKGNGGGLLGILLPLYTIGIVVFFSYTIIKLLNRKQDGNDMTTFDRNAQFQQAVFENLHCCHGNNHIATAVNENRKINGLSNGSTLPATTKLVVMSSICDSVEEVDECESNGNLINEAEIFQPEDAEIELEKNGDVVQKEEVDLCEKSVRVLGMETTESCQGGQEWTSGTNVLPVAKAASKSEIPSSGSVHNIVLCGTIPSDSRVLVSEARTDTVRSSQPSSVILESKVTLSVISARENKSMESVDEEVEEEEDVELQNYSQNETEDSQEIESETPIRDEPLTVDYNKNDVHIMPESNGNVGASYDGQ